MLDSIRRMLGTPKEVPEPQDAFRQLNEVAPLKATNRNSQKENTSGKSFICREAVLDRNERIGGYEFALGRELQSRMLEKSQLIRRIYDEAMLRNLAPLGVTPLLGGRFAFIRLSLASLKNPLVETLSKTSTAIMITPEISQDTDLAEVRANLHHLEKTGIKHGWTINRPRPEIAEFLHKADFIEIDSTALDGIQLKTMSLDFHAANKNQKLIASHLQTADDFHLCYRCGFNYFMGPFVTSRENWTPPKSEINRLHVFEALNMIRTGAEFDAIADRLRTDPILTFKLLRYINSPGIGLLQKVHEIQQALLILGRDRFYRWLSLLLFDFKQPGYRERILQEQALTRARFMETLAGLGSLPASSDELFITGLFSLMHILVAEPIEKVLKQVSLPEDAAASLRGEAGAMRNALILGMAVETADDDEMAKAAAQCGLDATVVANLMLDAMAWTQQILAVNE